MSEFFDAIKRDRDRVQKAILSNVIDPNLKDFFEKGKRAQVGEVREWNGVKMRKEASGWVPVGNESKTKKETEASYSEEDLDKYARQTSDEKLKQAAVGADEALRIAAKKELERRKTEGLEKDTLDSRRKRYDSFSTRYSAFSKYIEKKGSEEDPYGLPLSSEERAVIYTYTTPYFDRINRGLREVPPLKESEEFNESLNEVLDKIPDYSGTVYRGMGFSSSNDFYDFVSKMMGQISGGISFATPMSTSVSKDIANDFAEPDFSLKEGNYTVIMTIKSKTGKQISKYSDVPQEQEVLFKAGTKFRPKKSSMEEKSMDGKSFIVLSLELEEL